MTVNNTANLSETTAPFSTPAASLSTASPSSSPEPLCPGNQVTLGNGSACGCSPGLVKVGDSCSCPVGFTPEAEGCAGDSSLLGVKRVTCPRDNKFLREVHLQHVDVPVQMLMSVKVRSQGHAVSTLPALTRPARTPAAVSVVTSWVQQAARVCWLFFCTRQKKKTKTIMH